MPDDVPASPEARRPQNTHTALPTVAIYLVAARRQSRQRDGCSPCGQRVMGRPPFNPFWRDEAVFFGLVAAPPSFPRATAAGFFV